MMKRERMAVLGGYSGLVSVITFSLFLILAIFLHKNFSLMKNSLSDLGAGGVRDAYIFNLGLVLSGILFFIFSLSLIIFYYPRTIKCFSGFVLLVASIFLILIGLSPKGTPLHNPLAIVYYNLAMLGAFIYGIDSLRLRKYALGIYSVLVLPMGYLFYFLYPIVGFGTAELGEAILLLMWIVMISVIMIKTASPHRMVSIL